MSLPRSSAQALRYARPPPLIALRDPRPAMAFSSKHPFSSSSTPAYPRKDSQDKDSINPEANEYSKSGTDDGAARQEAAAFDPDITDPESQERKAAQSDDGTKTDDNPLNVSPANPEVSKPKSPTEGGAESGVGQKASGGGQMEKGKKVR